MNPRGGTNLGLPAFPDLAAVPGPVEAAFVIVPAERASEAVLACAARGIRAGVIVSSGFAEAGPEGERREEAMSPVSSGRNPRATRLEREQVVYDGGFENRKGFTAVGVRHSGMRQAMAEYDVWRRGQEDKPGGKGE